MQIGGYQTVLLQQRQILSLVIKHNALVSTKTTILFIFHFLLLSMTVNVNALLNLKISSACHASHDQ